MMDAIVGPGVLGLVADVSKYEFVDGRWEFWGSAAAWCRLAIRGVPIAADGGGDSTWRKMEGLSYFLMSFARFLQANHLATHPWG